MLKVKYNLRFDFWSSFLRNLATTVKEPERSTHAAGGFEGHLQGHSLSYCRNNYRIFEMRTLESIQNENEITGITTPWNQLKRGKIVCST